MDGAYHFFRFEEEKLNARRIWSYSICDCDPNNDNRNKINNLPMKTSILCAQLVSTLRLLVQQES